MNTSKSFLKQQTERAVFLAAQDEFFEWWGQWPSVAPNAFNPLSQAVKDLRKALKEFEEQNGRAERLLLLAQLRDSRPQGHTIDYEERLDELEDFLIELDDVAERARLRNRPLDETEQVWIWMAADKWYSMTGKEPKAAEHSAFWRCLDDFQLNPQWAKSPLIEPVGRTVVVGALKRWRDTRIATKSR